MKNRTDRNDEKLVVEDVHFLGPPLDRVVARVRQLGHEEGVEGVHLLVLLRATSGHDHLRGGGKHCIYKQHAKPAFQISDIPNIGTYISMSPKTNSSLEDDIYPGFKSILTKII